MIDAEPTGFTASVAPVSTPANRQTAIVACDGDLDLAAVGSFERAVAEAPGAGLVVDLSGVRFIDSSGVHALVSARSAVKAEGGGLEVVVAPESAVDRVLELSGLREELRPKSDRHAALNALDARGAGDANGSP